VYPSPKTSFVILSNAPGFSSWGARTSKKFGNSMDILESFMEIGKCGRYGFSWLFSGIITPSSTNLSKRLSCCSGEGVSEGGRHFLIG
tara:strand:+ start:1318 stop:1581 length:264 start_codon:yes stop_codon:yes gene_type:complete